METKNIDLQNLKRIEIERIDKTKYIDQNARIEKVEPIPTKYGVAIKVSTEPLEVIEREPKEDIIVRASRLFGLSDDNEIVVDGKLDKFLKSYNVEQPSELVGCVVTVELSENEYLTF